MATKKTAIKKPASSKRPAASRPKTRVVAKSKPIRRTKSKPAANPQAKAAKAKAAAKSRPSAKPKPSAKSRPAALPRPAAKSKPAAKLKPKVAAKPQSKVAAKAQSAPKPGVKPKPAKPVPAKALPVKAAKPEPKPAKAAVEAKPEPPPRPRVTNFSVGDKVVHPQHGAAVIAKRLKQQLAETVKEYFVLDIATDQLKVFVPVETIDDVIRPVISKNQTRMVFSKFREEPQEAGTNWSRWYKVLNEKMTSGDIYQVAEVVRDLSFAQQTKGISPALKRMLSRARLTLISEIRFALDIDEEEATRRLDKALPKVENPLPLPV